MNSQPPDSGSNKIDITSTALEKSVEVVRDFLNKLMMPAVEELGLLAQESIALWRFKNQVRVLTKAKEYCELNNISPQKISPKLLLPLVEGAALEDDEILQDKWAILLSNLVDSEQNIQNHVFPYILGQISLNEFLIMENVFKEWRTRTCHLESKLNSHKANFSKIESSLLIEIAKIEGRVEEASSRGRVPSELKNQLWDKERELRDIRSQETRLKRQINQPEVSLREFEMSNLTRLGLVRYIQETYAEKQRVNLPEQDDEWGSSIDIDVQLYSDSKHVLTELGVLFIKACTEKRKI